MPEQLRSLLLIQTHLPEQLQHQRYLHQWAVPLYWQHKIHTRLFGCVTNTTASRRHRWTFAQCIGLYNS